MDKINLDLNHFFRYVYGGILVWLSATLILPTQMINIKTNLGDLIGSFSILAIGTGFYVVYRASIGRLIDSVHLNRNWWWLKHSKADCVFDYLINPIGVKNNSNKETAFRLIRDKVFEKDIARIYHLRHSETHVLYLTFSICFLSTLLCLGKLLYHSIRCHPFISDIKLLIIFFVLALLFIWLGWMADKNLCKDERTYCETLKEEITNELKKTRLL